MHLHLSNKYTLFYFVLLEEMHTHAPPDSLCVHGGLVQLTWQLLAPPCMNPEQTMFSVKRWG